MSDDLALVDTNVLVYALHPECEHHRRSRQLLEDMQEGRQELCVVAQNVAEFYAVVTDSRRVAIPRKSADAIDAIERILAMPGMTLLPYPIDLVQRWMALVKRHPVTRSTVFDLQLVAAMLGNGVKKIYTFNHSDFAPFLDEIAILLP